MSQVVRIMIACACGAFIGALTALSGPHSAESLFVGCLLGGMIGAFVYALPDAIKAIPAAYRSARGWKPPEFFSSIVGLGIVLGVCAAIDFSSLLFLDSIAFKVKFAGTSIFLVTASLIGIPFLSTLIFVREKKTRGDRINFVLDLRRAIYYVAPPVIVFWHLPRGLWYFTKQCAKAMWRKTLWVWGGVLATLHFFAEHFVPGAISFGRFIGRFSKQVFIRVHMHLMLLCFVDAALGSAVGFTAGSPLVGALAGAFFGFVNYEVISKRVLKVVPLRAK